MTHRHIVLAGDSIFDNDGYVPGEPGVIEQLRRTIPPEWSASKVAVDGDCVRHVAGQIGAVGALPTNATDLVVSVGGNDALGSAALLADVRSPADLPALLREPLAAFRTDYQAMLDAARATGLRVHVCTIYTAVPFDEEFLRTFAPLGIAAFNEVIGAEAAERNIPVIRLERVCTAPDDYAAISPIEPSAKGGQKIVDAIVGALGESHSRAVRLSRKEVS